MPVKVAGRLILVSGILVCCAAGIGFPSRAYCELDADRAFAGCGAEETRLSPTTDIFDCLFLLPTTSSAPPDARSQGMGRAFTAIAEGPAAVFWNPGALGLPQPQSLLPFSRAELGPGVSGDVVLYSFGGTGRWKGIGAGALLNRLSYGESECGGSDYTLRLGGGLNLASFIAPAQERFRWGVGASFKRIKMDNSYEGSFTECTEFAPSGWDIDLGTLLTYHSYQRPSSGDTHGLQSYVGMRAGAVVGNLLKNEIEIVEGADPWPLSRVLRLGFAFEGAFRDSPPFGHAVRAVLSVERKVIYIDAGDCDERTSDHFGGELRLLGIFAARVGYIDDPRNKLEDWSWGLGLGIDLRDVVAERFGVELAFASIPRADPFERIHQITLSAWIDS
ncbi:MAG: hypothetical protein KAW17_01955 [Candidatus Eisenbacteria sp.]|nr:hypothetical protein [Candidatus Eisenbacteria bacterium]